MASLDQESGLRPADRRSVFTKLANDIDELYDEKKITVGSKAFLTHLTSMYWGCRGIPENLLDISYPVLMQKVLLVPSALGARLDAIVWAPWSMKPFWAIISDMLPIFYYKKRFHMLIVSTMGSVSATAVFLADKETLGMETASVAFLLYVMMNIGIAMCDSLSQGKYTEICKWKGSTIVSFVSASKTAAGTVAAFIGPWVNDRQGPQVSMGIAVPFLGQAACVQGLNFMGDRQLETAFGCDTELWQKDWKIISTGLTLGAIAASPVMFTLFLSQDLADTLTLPFVSLGLTGVMAMSFWSLPRSVALINVYIMFCRVATLVMRYPLQQWYTTPEIHCGPDTPHFPFTVYQTLGLVAANLMSLFAVYLFEKYIYYWNAQKAFWVTTLMTVFAACTDLAMLTRFNQTLLSIFPGASNRITWLCGSKTFGEFAACEPYGYRIDDLIGFVFGSQGIKYIAMILDDMPSTILLSKLCPAGVETTVFAILAALMNLGYMISGLLGGKFLAYYGFNIKASSGACDIVDFMNPQDEALAEREGCEEAGHVWMPDYKVYTCNMGEGWFGLEALAWATVVGGMFLPLTTIPATWALIPNQPLCDDFVDQSAASEEIPAGIHPAAGSNGSFADLRTAEASHAEMEKSSFLILTKGGGSRLM